MLCASDLIESLWRKKGGKKATTLCGDGYGDNGKRAVESAIENMFEIFVRVSGGSNTGGTAWIKGKDGLLHQMIFHLLPSQWPAKVGIIGDYVLFDLKRAIAEIEEVTAITGGVSAPLYISKKAPLYLPYYGLLEAYSEKMKGAGAVGSTRRGIAFHIAAVDRREAPLVGYLLHPYLLRKWVTDCYKQHELVLKELERMLKGTKDEFDLSDYHPDKVTEELLALVPKVNEYIADTGPILLDLLKKNSPMLFGLSQGFGLHFLGTYPFNSATQTIASATAYCGGMPMDLFGAVILVSKMIPTRVGAGPFTTGWWHRDAAMQFPKLYPYLFSVLDECDEKKRAAFIKQRRRLINSGAFTWIDVAMLMQVLLNNLGATTLRGREPGGPNLYETACAAAVNGADCIALTQADVLEHLKIRLPFATSYHLGGERFKVPTIPTPVELYNDPRFTVGYEHLDVDLRGMDLYGKSELPPIFRQIRELYHLHTGVPIGMISTSPKGDEGKIFYKVT